MEENPLVEAVVEAVVEAFGALLTRKCWHGVQ